jgi:hypothetical protein
MCWNFEFVDADVLRRYVEDNRPMEWQMVIYKDIIPGYYCKHHVWHMDENYRVNHPDVVARFPELQKRECCGCCKREDFPGRAKKEEKPRDTFEF